MKKKFILSFMPAAFCAIFLSVLIPPAALTAEDLSGVVSKLQRRYDGITAVSADFTQEVSSKIQGRTQVSQGTVFFKKPGKMKWLYTSPARDELVSNGKTLWVFERDLNQVIERPLEGNSSAAADFLTGVGNLARDFEITLARGGGDTYRLGLVPREPQPNVKKFYMELDKTRFIVVKTIVEDYFGNVTTVGFRNIKLNAPVEDSFFEFSPPKGAAVVRP